MNTKLGSTLLALATLTAFGRYEWPKDLGQDGRTQAEDADDDTKTAPISLSMPHLDPVDGEGLPQAMELTLTSTDHAGVAYHGRRPYSPGASFDMNAVRVGAYDLELTALIDSQIVYRGTATVRITSDRTTEVHVKLERVDGAATGGLVVWAEQPDSEPSKPSDSIKPDEPREPKEPKEPGEPTEPHDPRTVLNAGDKAEFVVLSGTGLGASGTAGSVNDSVRATNGHDSGRIYFEVTVDAVGDAYNAIGVASGSAMLELAPGDNDDGCGYERSGHVHCGSAQAQLAPYGVGDVIGVAVDLDRGLVFFSKNGEWLNGGDPASSADGLAISGWTAGRMIYPMLNLSEGDAMTASFGWDRPLRYLPSPTYSSHW
jgi:hypothetical protein